MSSGRAEVGSRSVVTMPRMSRAASILLSSVAGGMPRCGMRSVGTELSPPVLGTAVGRATGIETGRLARAEAARLATGVGTIAGMLTGRPTAGADAAMLAKGAGLVEGMLTLRPRGGAGLESARTRRTEVVRSVEKCIVFGVGC